MMPGIEHDCDMDSNAHNQTHAVVDPVHVRLT